MALSGVFDDHDCRRQDLSTPRSPGAAPREYSPEPFDGEASVSPGASDVGNVAPPARSIHSPPGPNRGFWRFVPAFTYAGGWPGRPPDTAPGAGPVSGASADSLAAALAPAPTTPAPPCDAAPARGGHLQGPACALDFDHYPLAVLLQRCAEISFYPYVPRRGHAACGASELCQRARTVGEFFEAHHGPHLLAC